VRGSGISHDPTHRVDQNLDLLNGVVEGQKGMHCRLQSQPSQDRPRQDEDRGRRDDDDQARGIRELLTLGLDGAGRRDRRAGRHRRCKQRTQLDVRPEHAAEPSREQEYRHKGPTLAEIT
jgi:hypothetical protein